MSVEFPRDDIVTEVISPSVGQENELEAGEYIIIVPEGQKAIIRYEKI
jgi:hypothetical protein